MNTYRFCRRCSDAFYPRRAHHRLCLPCWSQEQERTAPDLIGVLRGAVELCHPDRHPAERREQATKITRELLELLEAKR